MNETFPRKVHELIVKWCRSPKAMHIGIGAKLMSLSLLAISGADNPKATRKSLAEILPKLGEILLGQGDDGTTVYSFALAHVVELLNTIISSTPFKTEIFSVSTINAEKVIMSRHFISLSSLANGFTFKSSFY